MKSSLKIATVFGIPIFIHWTFSLLIVYVLYRSFREGSSLIESLWMMALLVVVFLCVTLHELGHAMAARRYGIITRDITLLPIGGLARLNSMPNKPWQEFVVAIAGPLVNVVIALALIPILLLTDTFFPPGEISIAKHFLFVIFGLNVVLVVFNMVPAFPMDGGRVLRALLSMKFSRVSATRVASLLGRLVAVGFVIFGLGLYPNANPENFNPVLALIGGFIFLSARQEYQYVKYTSTIESLKISEIMKTDFLRISVTETIGEASRVFQNENQVDFPVLDPDGYLKGMISRSTLLKAVADGNEDQFVTGFMNRNFYKLKTEDSVKDIFFVMQQKKIRSLPVYENGVLVGLLVFDDLLDKIKS